MPKTAADYLNQARAMLEEGFAFEARRKDALGCTRVAHDIAMRQISDALLAPGVDRDTQEHRDLYWGRPEAAHWQSKHAAMFAAYPEAVSIANQAAALRFEIKAAPVVKKKTKTEAAREVRAADAMTCQCCGRDILAETGVIAHHGYQRPGDGWQTASCFGARKLPFENDHKVLDQLIAGLKNGVESLNSQIADIKAERVPVTHTWTLYNTDSRGRTIYHSVKLTRDQLPGAMALAPGWRAFEAVSGKADKFEALKARNVRDVEGTLRATKEQLSWCEARRAGWKQTHQWDAASKTWKKVA